MPREDRYSSPNPLDWLDLNLVPIWLLMGREPGRLAAGRGDHGGKALTRDAHLPELLKHHSLVCLQRRPAISAPRLRRGLCHDPVDLLHCLMQPGGWWGDEGDRLVHVEKEGLPLDIHILPPNATLFPILCSSSPPHINNFPPLFPPVPFLCMHLPRSCSPHLPVLSILCQYYLKIFASTSSALFKQSSISSVTI